MRFFFDTEFATAVREDGATEIRPISIGIVAEDGREYYAEFEGAHEAAASQEWLQSNVLPHLTSATPEALTFARRAGNLVPIRAKDRVEIAREIERFCAPKPGPDSFCPEGHVWVAGECRDCGLRLWPAPPPDWIASYGGFDWVVLSAIWGGMMAMPEGWPYHFHEAQDMDLPRVEQQGAEHNALADARTLRKAWLLKPGPEAA